MTGIDVSLDAIKDANAVCLDLMDAMGDGDLDAFDMFSYLRGFDFLCKLLKNGVTILTEFADLDEEEGKIILSRLPILQTNIEHLLARWDDLRMGRIKKRTAAEDTVLPPDEVVDMPAPIEHKPRRRTSSSEDTVVNPDDN